ncbi:(S)-benzoin forming benzil reductase [Oceanobacillus chungangensis]|uniref:Short-chain dehydrogenase n=1 Tax=Oceanobacillus chungangensis TaxID=1229152 RepID=A0A3D8PVT2_9BACI|nr:(S)-benzoin forming benzil reductase [Oceanobacillus chungangensis]RDW19862.1 short-chain dehydrogenase [Oceanobacillus chungangensis]
MERFAIVTGASKGLGKEIASLFLESGVNVIGISRTENNHLSILANELNKSYHHYSCDLTDHNALQSTYEQISELLLTVDLTSLQLVNNAATIEPISPSINITSEELIQHFQLNTIAPMLLTNFFLKKAFESEIPFMAVTITSGAADRPIYGWSAYGSSKASINMFTKTVALEQEELATGNKVIAFNPGVMDTEMQEEIRSSSKEQFSDVESFINFKKNNLLNDPRLVAGVLIDILNDEGVMNGKIYDIKNYV